MESENATRMIQNFVFLCRKFASTMAWLFTEYDVARAGNTEILV